MTDAYDLRRFVDAQRRRYAGVVTELERGRKTGHWIWYIFPQIAGLGFSHMSKRYAISSQEEARAYARHPELGPRLVECIELVLAVDGKSAEQILGSLDALKLRSCLTLFHNACPDDAIFREALDRLFAGEQDPLTLEALCVKS